MSCGVCVGHACQCEPARLVERLRAVAPWLATAYLEGRIGAVLEACLDEIDRRPAPPPIRPRRFVGDCGEGALCTCESPCPGARRSL